MTTIAELLRGHPELSIFSAIVLGFVIGHFHFKGVGLGTVVGTLLAGLAIGIVTRPEVPDLVKWAFFDLFLFAIGYGTGPQFFAGLKKEAIPQIWLALVVACTGLFAALAMAWVFRFDAGIAAGLASGGLTQSAALGTALVTLHDLPLTPEVKSALSSHVPIADAVTYVFGDIGVILFLIVAAPLISRTSVHDAAIALENQLAHNRLPPGTRRAMLHFGYRAYRVENAEMAGQPIERLEAALTGDRAYVERVKRGDKVVEHPEASFVIEAGDVVVIGARQRGLVHAATRVGPEVDAPDLMEFAVREAAVVVTSGNIAGHTIAALDKRYGRGAFLVRITRGQEDLPLLPRTILQRGDVLHAVGSLDKIARAARTAGFIDPDPGRFALPFLAAGIVVGTLLGLLQIHVGPVPVGLGTSCAILVIGLVTGWARSRYPLFGGIPEPATRLLQDVGLTVFIAVVGLTAGPHAVAVLNERGLPFFLTIAGAGAVVTLAPQIVGYGFGRYVLRMPIAILLGGLAGAQTATPALNALKDASGSNVFVLGYAIPYAINNVLLTLWGTVIVIVVQSWGR